MSQNGAKRGSKTGNRRIYPPLSTFLPSLFDHSRTCLNWFKCLRDLRDVRPAPGLVGLYTTCFTTSFRASVTSYIEIIKDFVFLTPFRLYFWTFLDLYGNLEPEFQREYWLSALLDLHPRLINHLVKFQGFSDLIFGEIHRFYVFNPILAPFWTVF